MGLSFFSRSVCTEADRIENGGEAHAHSLRRLAAGKFTVETIRLVAYGIAREQQKLSIGRKQKCRDKGWRNYGLAGGHVPARVGFVVAGTGSRPGKKEKTNNQLAVARSSPEAGGVLPPHKDIGRWQQVLAPQNARASSAGFVFK